MADQDLSTLLSKAEKAYRSGSFSQAAEFYRQAQQLSAAAGDARKAAESANNASVALLQSGNASAALEAAQGTDEYFAQAGDIRFQAMALGNQAAALDALHRLDEALARYRLCSDLLKQTGDEENRAHVLKSISSLQIRTGHQLEALASMDAALQSTQKPSLKERILKKLLRVPFKMMKHGE